MPAKAARLKVGEIVMHPGAEATENNTALETRLYNIRWVAYAPTNFNPTAAPPILPSDDSIRADLEVLKAAGFTGLVTYGAHLAVTPRIAEEAGFQGLLLGVWDPRTSVKYSCRLFLSLGQAG
jgi:hypothetical protein